jgi:hypothetical protein
VHFEIRPRVSTAIRSKVDSNTPPELKWNVDVSCKGGVYDSLSREFRANEVDTVSYKIATPSLVSM